MNKTLLAFASLAAFFVIHSASAQAPQDYTIVVENKDSITYLCNSVDSRPDAWPASNLSSINVLGKGKVTTITCPSCDAQGGEEDEGDGANGAYFCEGEPGGADQPQLSLIADWSYPDGMPLKENACTLEKRPGYKCSSSVVGRQIKFVISKK